MFEWIQKKIHILVLCKKRILDKNQKLPYKIKKELKNFFWKKLKYKFCLLVFYVI